MFLNNTGRKTLFDDWEQSRTKKYQRQPFQISNRAPGENEENQHPDRRERITLTLPEQNFSLMSVQTHPEVISDGGFRSKYLRSIGLHWGESRRSAFIQEENDPMDSAKMNREM